MTFHLTFLGTGSSGGVPRIGNNWGHADPSNPKNRRRRCAVLVQRKGPKGTTTVLVDTPPDLRDQCLERDVVHVDGVLYTHDHADHAHGIDDLRVFSINQRRRIDVFMDDVTWDSLLLRFRYCFEKKPNSNYMPILTRHRIVPGEPVRIEGAGGPVTAIPVLQDHGEGPSLGFRFGSLCYSPDIVGVPPQSEPLLAGLDVWIVDALRPMPHPCHWSLKQALAEIGRRAPRTAYLTHLHVDLDYDEMCRALPGNVRPAYDGLKITFEG